MSKLAAKIVMCSDNCDAHWARDSCSTCAPWWDKYYICPVDNTKLSKKGHCRECRKYYEIKIMLTTKRGDIEMSKVGVIKQINENSIYLLRQLKSDTKPNLRDYYLREIRENFTKKLKIYAAKGVKQYCFVDRNGHVNSGFKIIN